VITVNGTIETLSYGVITIVIESAVPGLAAREYVAVVDVLADLDEVESGT